MNGKSTGCFFLLITTSANPGAIKWRTGGPKATDNGYLTTNR